MVDWISFHLLWPWTFYIKMPLVSVSSTGWSNGKSTHRSGCVLKRCAQQEVVLTNKSLGLDPGKILTHNETRLMVETHYGWWFQPTWNIVVKLGISPQVGVKIKNMWNYQILFVGQAFGPSTKTLQWLIGRISRVDAPNTELIEGQQNLWHIRGRW